MSYVGTLNLLLMKPETLQTRLLKRISRKQGDVFLRADFEDLGGYDQVGRVLRELVRKGQLLKLGYGVYARAIKSPLSGKPMPPKGVATVAEAVERLGIKTVPTCLEQDYNAGKTTQVPTGRVIGIQGRLRRKLGYNDITVSFERVGPTIMSGMSPSGPA
jgi:hypothetical protein